MSLDTWFHDIVAHSSIVFSHVLGSWLSGQGKGCHCSCHLGQSETDSRVLDILQHQLERCGPENLSPTSFSWPGLWTVLLYLSLVLVGGVVGWVARGRVGPGSRSGESTTDECEDAREEAQRALRIKLHGASAW